MDLKEIERIKQLGISGESKIWVETDGRLGLILGSKYGKNWFKQATQEDIERIIVF